MIPNKLITFIVFKVLDAFEYGTDKFIAAPGTDKQKSLFLSIFLFLSMLLLLFCIRFWPPSNIAELVGTGGGGGGVSVNFGDTDAGMGKNFQNQEPVKDNSTKPVAVKEVQEEQEIIAEENSKDEGVVIPKNVNIKKIKEVIVKESKTVAISKPEKEKPKVIAKPQNDALSNILKGSKTGDGDTGTVGNQGAANGGLSNSGYGAGGSGTGSGGGNGSENGVGNGVGNGSGSGSGSGNGTGRGSGSGYSLGNRKALAKPAPNYTCDEVGKVVVQITVDKNGKTIAAVPGIKGSTNTAKCLLDQAKIAALNTRWDASEDAPDQQVGKIEYNFKLN